MSAAKRVQKLLRQAEKRSTSKIDLANTKISEKEKLERVAQAHESLKKEAVYIKATGRAIDRAMSIGKWFQDKDEEYEIQVETGSVLVVDDIVVDADSNEVREQDEKADEGSDSKGKEMDEGTEGKDENNATDASNQRTTDAERDTTKGEKPTVPSRKKRKRNSKAKASPGVEPPESRTRYVNSVNIAVTLK
jgi:ribonuclease P/MRP protein subunit POP7